MYRYSKKSYDELIGIVKSHKDNLWLPYQVALEFFNNRIRVIEDVKSGFDKLLDKFESIDNILSGVLDLEKYKKDTAHNIGQLHKDIKQFGKHEETKIKKWKQEFEDNDKEEILKEILSLYDGKVGNDYDDKEELEKLYKEGEKRYGNSIPPGFADRKEKEKEGSRHLYGDLIWWKQAMGYAKSNKRDLVIVTDDSKEDWWFMVNGKTYGPRVELIREFAKETNGQSFLMYQTHQFMEMAKIFDGANVSDSSIKEAKVTGSTESNLFDVPYLSLEYPYMGSPLANPAITGQRGWAEMPTLDNHLFAGHYMPQGLQGVYNLHGMEGTKGGGILGMLPNVEQGRVSDGDIVGKLADFYAKQHDGTATIPGLSDVSSKRKDLLSKQEGEK